MNHQYQSVAESSHCERLEGQMNSGCPKHLNLLEGCFHNTPVKGTLNILGIHTFIFSRLLTCTQKMIAQSLNHLPPRCVVHWTKTKTPKYATASRLLVVIFALTIDHTGHAMPEHPSNWMQSGFTFSLFFGGQGKRKFPTNPIFTQLSTK